MRGIEAHMPPRTHREEASMAVAMCEMKLLVLVEASECVNECLDNEWTQQKCLRSSKP